MHLTTTPFYRTSERATIELLLPILAIRAPTVPSTSFNIWSGILRPFYFARTSVSDFYYASREIPYNRCNARGTRSLEGVQVPKGRILAMV
jgi:hypothetical protein